MALNKQGVTDRRSRRSYSKPRVPGASLVKVHGEFEDYLLSTETTSQRHNILKEIENSIAKLVSSYPDDTTVLNLLSRVTLERGDSKGAEDILRKALRISPECPSNNFTLGQMCISAGKYKKALEYLTTALKKAPNTDQIYANIAYAHLKDGNTIEAYILYRRLCFSGNTQYNGYLVECLRRAEVHNYSQQMEQDIIKVLTFDDVDHNQLSSVVASLMIAKYHLRRKNNIIELIDIVDDVLLKRSLQKMNICNATTEKFITLVRTSLLKECVDLDRIPDTLLDLIYSIGTYCDNNEYVFSVTDGEDKMLQYLVATVAMIIKVGEPAGKVVGGLALLSMYMPVNEVCEHLDINLEEFQGWHSTGDRLRLKSIGDAKAEKKYLDLIDTPTSEESESHFIRMRRQYEENPYPRWTNYSKTPSNDYIRALKTQLPELCRVLEPAHERQINPSPKNALVAGCGTGRHAVQLASAYPNLEVMAIDISRRSLAYGMRKADEFKLSNLKYRYQNLLALSQEGEQYDAIECSGVLHHLESPEEGLHALVAALKIDGILKLGLYSARARRHVSAARSLIDKSGLKDATLLNIRQVRSEIISARWGNEVADVALSFDFYTTSGCRDLLFHFHEVNYTPLLLKELLQGAGLHFLGFVHLSQSAKTAYLQRFPEDKNLVNLDNWEEFELDNPYLFVAMYQFYCSRNS